MKEHITISLPTEVKKELAETAARQGGSASDLAAYAIRRYLDWRREADSKVSYSGKYHPTSRRNRMSTSIKIPALPGDGERENENENENMRGRRNAAHRFPSPRRE